VCLPYRCDHFELDRDRRRQRADFDCRARWIWFALAGKMFGVKLVVDRKILFHVREKHSDIDDVLPRRAGVFKHQAHIFKHSVALRFDIVTDDIVSGIERDAGNFFAAARAGSDSGEKEEIAHAFRVRKRAHWLRRASAFKRFGHPS